MIVPLFVGREKSIRALEEVMKRRQAHPAGDARRTRPTTIRRPDAIYEVGTLASVLQLLKLPDGTVKVLVEGVARAEIEAFTPQRGLLRGRGRGARR